MVFFFRGPSPHQSLWERFRTSPEGFTATFEDDYWTFHAVAGAERTVDLFFALLAELPGTVSVAIRDARLSRAWTGVERLAGAVRDGLAPLRAPLVAHGGAELTVFTEHDQVTLNPVCELFIYSHSERWAHVLEGKGLAARRLVRTRSWGLRGTVPPAPELSEALARAAAALELAAA